MFEQHVINTIQTASQQINPQIAIFVSRHFFQSLGEWKEGIFSKHL
jgi:hypothetical protein